MFTPNPGVFAGGVETLTPYQRYQAYIRTLGPVLSWTGSGFSSGVVEVAATQGGTMIGSCWSGRVFATPVPRRRLALHAFPNPAALDALVGTDIFLSMSYLEERTTVSSYNRNGYLSSAGAAGAGQVQPGGLWDVYTCTEVLYWQNDQAWKINPFAGTAPVTFVVP